MRRYLPFAIIGVIFVIAAGGGLLLFRSKNASTPIKIVPGKPGAEPAHIRGSDQARVTLEEFGDYQCVPCHFLAKTLLKVEHDYGTKVRIIFRHYPLKKHVHAYTAACAAEAAGVQGRFWEMHDLLFQNSPQWGKETPRPVLSLGPSVPDISPEEKTAEVRAIFAGYAEKLAGCRTFQKGHGRRRGQGADQGGPGTRRLGWSRPHSQLIHERTYGPL